MCRPRGEGRRHHSGGSSSRDDDAIMAEVLRRNRNAAAGGQNAIRRPAGYKANLAMHGAGSRSEGGTRPDSPPREVAGRNGGGGGGGVAIAAVAAAPKAAKRAPTAQSAAHAASVRARYGPRNDARAAKSRVDDSGWKL